MSLNQCALKKELCFFENTQLVSNKEWEIVNLEVIPDDNPELKKNGTSSFHQMRSNSDQYASKECKWSKMENP